MSTDPGDAHSTENSLPSASADKLSDQSLLTATQLRMQRDQLLSTSDQGTPEMFGNTELSDAFQGLLGQMAGYLDYQAQQHEAAAAWVRQHGTSQDGL